MEQIHDILNAVNDLPLGSTKFLMYRLKYKKNALHKCLIKGPSNSSTGDNGNSQTIDLTVDDNGNFLLTIWKLLNINFKKIQ